VTEKWAVYMAVEKQLEGINSRQHVKYECWNFFHRKVDVLMNTCHHKNWGHAVKCKVCRQWTLLGNMEVHNCSALPVAYNHLYFSDIRKMNYTLEQADFVLNYESQVNHRFWFGRNAILLYSPIQKYAQSISFLQFIFKVMRDKF
jgi:hypothetical protein